MRHHRQLSTTAVLALFSGLSASADALKLTPAGTLNITALNLASIGDLAFDRQAAHLCVTDGTNGSLIYRVSPTNGALIGTSDASSVPGLAGGPDALAVLSASPPDLCVFSSLSQSRAGRVSGAGALVADYGGALDATGADSFGASVLIVVTGTVPGGGSVFRNLNPTTGAVIASVPILGSTSRLVDVAFDPHSQFFYALAEDTNQLLELDLSNGTIASQTDLSPFLLQGNTISGGIAFNLDGSKLFVATGTGNAAHGIVVLQRDFSVTSCDGAGTTAACPCGVSGQVGRGCPNSVIALGGVLDTSGIPDVSADTLVFTAASLPTTTTGLLFQGTAAVAPSTVFGDGLLCVGGTVVRMSIKTASAGILTFPGSGDPSAHVAGLVTGFSDRFYQLWYRDAAAFCTSSTFNTTNALKVHWQP